MVNVLRAPIATVSRKGTCLTPAQMLTATTSTARAKVVHRQLTTNAHGMPHMASPYRLLSRLDSWHGRMLRVMLQVPETPGVGAAQEAEEEVEGVVVLGVAARQGHVTRQSCPPMQARTMKHRMRRSQHCAQVHLQHTLLHLLSSE
jgi:hypothetical protein